MFHIHKNADRHPRELHEEMPILVIPNLTILVDGREIKLRSTTPDLNHLAITAMPPGGHLALDLPQDIGRKTIEGILTLEVGGVPRGEISAGKKHANGRKGSLE